MNRRKRLPAVSPSSLIPCRQHFFRPSPLLRELTLLQSLRENDAQPQSVLARRCAASPAIVNKYIESLSEEGILNPEPVDKKSLRYPLTDKGESRRLALLDAYSAEVVRIYAFMRDLLRAALQRFAGQGLKRLALFGASATGEMLLVALEGLPDMQVIAVVDSDPAKQGTTLFGHTVEAPERLTGLDCDAVVVASWGQKEEIRKRLSVLSLPQGVEVITL